MFTEAATEKTQYWETTSPTNSGLPTFKCLPTYLHLHERTAWRASQEFWYRYTSQSLPSRILAFRGADFHTRKAWINMFAPKHVDTSASVSPWPKKNTHLVSPPPKFHDFIRTISGKSWLIFQQFVLRYHGVVYRECFICVQQHNVTTPWLEEQRLKAESHYISRQEPCCPKSERIGLSETNDPIPSQGLWGFMMVYHRVPLTSDITWEWIRTKSPKIRETPFIFSLFTHIFSDKSSHSSLLIHHSHVRELVMVGFSPIHFTRCFLSHFWQKLSNRGRSDVPAVACSFFSLSSISAMASI